MLLGLTAQKHSFHHESQSQGERAGTCPFNAASTLQPDLPPRPRGAATEDDRDHSAGCTGLFFQYHKRHTRAVLPLGSPTTRPVANCTLEWPRRSQQKEEEDQTHLGLCSLSLVKRLLKLTTWIWPILHLNHHHIANFSLRLQMTRMPHWMKWEKK